ncbi:MAG: hypothetical protein AAF409_12485 [Pseudomonadota bacterium]
MKRALIVTDVDLGAAEPERLARLSQIANMYASLPFGCDMMVFDPGEAPGRPVENVPPNIAGLAHLQTNTGEAPRTRHQRIHNAIEALTGSIPPAVVHFDGVMPDFPDVDGALRVFDTAHDVSKVPCLDGVDLVLAAVEDVRTAPAFDGLTAVRLPLLVDERPARVGPGQMVGWPGPLGANELAAWAALLGVMAARGQRLEAGLLLTSSALGAMEIPPLHARAWARPEHYDRQIAQRVLGLGVLPAAGDGRVLFDLCRLLALRCPILTTAAVADRFEGRWQLPTCDTPEHFAGRIDAWTSGRDSAALAEATDATRAAFVADQGAMTRYVVGIIGSLLEGR